MVQNARSFGRLGCLLIGIQLMAFSATPANSQLFWAEDGGIGHAGIYGEHPSVLTSAFNPAGIAADGNLVVWSDIEPRVPIGPTGVITRIDVNGSHRENIAGNQFEPRGVELNPLQPLVYWTDGLTNSIWQTQLDGKSQPTRILGDQAWISNLHELAFDFRFNVLYFTLVNPLLDSRFPGGIGRLDLATGQATTIVSGLNQPWGLALDSDLQMLFWSDQLNGEGVIKRTVVGTNSEAETIVRKLNQPQGIAIDPMAHRLYWADAASQLIQSSDYRGEFIETLPIPVRHPSAVAIVSVPEPIRAVDGITCFCAGILSRCARKRRTKVDQALFPTWLDAFDTLIR